MTALGAVAGGEGGRAEERKVAPERRIRGLGGSQRTNRRGAASAGEAAAAAAAAENVTAAPDITTRMNARRVLRSNSAERLL